MAEILICNNAETLTDGLNEDLRCFADQIKGMMVLAAIKVLLQSGQHIINVEPNYQAWHGGWCSDHARRAGWYVTPYIVVCEKNPSVELIALADRAHAAMVTSYQEIIQEL